MADPAFLAFAQAESSRPLVPVQSNGVVSYVVDFNNREQVLSEQIAGRLGLASPAFTAHEQANYRERDFPNSRIASVRRQNRDWERWGGTARRDPLRVTSPKDMLISSRVAPEYPLLDIPAPLRGLSGADDIGAYKKRRASSVSKKPATKKLAVKKPVLKKKRPVKP